MIVVIATALTYGSIEFRSDEAPDPSKIPGMFFYLSGFYAFALPVIASAARMPGTYADRGNA